MLAAAARCYPQARNTGLKRRTGPRC